MTHTNTWIPALISVLALGLGACAQDWTSVTNIHDENVYNHFAYGASGQDLRTDIIGSPLASGPADADRVGAAVLDLMQGQVWGAPTTLTLSQDTPHPNVRIVLAFDPPATVHSATLCASPPDTHAPKSETLYALMAFCVGARASTSVETWMARPTKLDDPVFMRAVKSMTMNLIPSSDPRDRRNCVALNCD